MSGSGGNGHLKYVSVILLQNNQQNCATDISKVRVSEYPTMSLSHKKICVRSENLKENLTKDAKIPMIV